MGWMHWTAPTAAFFAALIALLVAMAVWEIRSPTVRRRGWLRVATTRGDRLFLGLLLTAALVLAWVGLFDSPPWPAFGIAVLAMAAILRSG